MLSSYDQAQSLINHSLFTSLPFFASALKSTDAGGGLLELGRGLAQAAARRGADPAEALQVITLALPSLLLPPCWDVPTPCSGTA